MFSLFFRKSATEPVVNEEWTMLDVMQPLSPELVPESLSGSIISEIETVTSNLSQSVNNEVNVDLSDSFTLPLDDRAEIKRINDLNKKLKTKSRYERVPACYKAEKPWRRFPGCSNGCKTERQVMRKEEKKQKRIDLKHETRIINTLVM